MKSKASTLGNERRNRTQCKSRGSVSRRRRRNLPKRLVELCDVRIDGVALYSPADLGDGCGSRSPVSRERSLRTRNRPEALPTGTLAAAPCKGNRCAKLEITICDFKFKSPTAPMTISPSPRRKSDRAAPRSWRHHQLPDGVEDHLELGSYFFSRASSFRDRSSVRGQHLPQAHEGPHDLDVHRDSPRTAQHAGKHRHALLGEGIGGGPATPPSSALEITVCDFKIRTFLGELEHEIFGKPLALRLTACTNTRGSTL